MRTILVVVVVIVQHFGVRVQGLNLRFEFGLYLNLNLLRGLGSGILLNLIPEPQVQNQVWTGFGRFRNWTVASLELMKHLHLCKDSLAVMCCNTDRPNIFLVVEHIKHPTNI